MRIIKAGDFLSPKTGSHRPFTVPPEKEPQPLPYSRWANYMLACGHLTTPETQELLHVFRPSRGLHWCETCTKWRARKAVPKPPKTPQEPLF